MEERDRGKGAYIYVGEKWTHILKTIFDDFSSLFLYKFNPHITIHYITV